MQRFLVSKRQRQGDEGGPSAEACSPPPVIVSWNCNSLRLRAERKELGETAAMRNILAFVAALRESSGQEFVHGMHPRCVLLRMQTQQLLAPPSASSSSKHRTPPTHMCAGAAVAAFLAAGATALVLQEVRLKPEERAACESALRWAKSSSCMAGACSWLGF